MSVEEHETPSDRAEPEGLGDVVHWIILAVLSFAPATTAALFPEGVLDDKNRAFIAIYAVTLPLALATTLIYLGAQNNWFGTTGYMPVVWISLIVIATSAFATGTAGAGGSDAITSYSQAADKVAHPVAKLALVALFIVFAYAQIYGFPLFIAGIIVGGYAGYRIDRILFASARRTP